MNRTHALGLALFASLSFAAGQGCSGCARPGTEDPENNGSSSGTASGGSSGVASSGGASSGGASSGTSGSGGSSGGASSGGASGGASSGTSGFVGDAGNPLEQPRDLFCSGTGAIVGGTASGNTCAGQLAEETFTFGVCACENITVGSTLTVDAFDSTLGPYGLIPDGGTMPNVRQDGHTGMNGGPLVFGGKFTGRGNLYVGGGNIQMSSDSNVYGSLFANGSLVNQMNTNGTVHRNAFVNGNVASGYTVTGNLVLPEGATNNGTVMGMVTRAPVDLSLPCRCGESEKIDIAAFTAWAATNNDNMVFGDGGTLAPDAYVNGGPGTLRMPCGRYYLSSINQGGSLTLIPEGRVVLFVDGDMTVGGINIVIAADTELDLFVAGTLTVNSAAAFGDEANPSRVRTYVGGDLDVQASSDFNGNVYAPNAEVTFGGSTTIHGSLFVNRVTFGGSATVHFDSAIRRAGDVCDPPDAGTPDAGNPPADAGMPPADAGNPPADAGMNPVDAGMPPADAGVPPADAGQPPRDAGPPPDAAVGCTNKCDSVCGDNACRIPTGSTTGTCGSCVLDTDCCASAGEVCELGQCVVIGG